MRIRLGGIPIVVGAALLAVHASGQPAPSTGVGAVPQRLAADVAKRAGEAQVAPLVLSLDEVVCATAAVSLDKTTLVLPQAETQHVLVAAVSIDTRTYNVFRVRMRADGGSDCRVNWVSEIETNLDFNPGVTHPIYADNEFHTYTLALDALQGTWVGAVREIRFFPAYRARVNAEVTHMELAYEPRSAVNRITFPGDGLVTQEAFFGTQAPWRVLVPDGGVFEAGLAMGRRAWKPYSSDGARFVARLECDGIRRVLIDRTLRPAETEADRRWIRTQCGLAAFAGREITLHLEIDPLDSTEGDYAYWTAPTVFGGNNVRRTPVFLVSLDTVRADHLAVYGYGRDTMPFVTGWAERETVVFEHAVSQDAWTLPAHITMLTGLYPKNHGVAPGVALSEQKTTLPEWLREHGYASGGFTSVLWWLEPEYGFADGFDVYDTPPSYRNGFAANAKALAWLDQRPFADVFLFLHNYDAHGKSKKLGYTLPYEPALPEHACFSKAYITPPTFQREGKETPLASDLLMTANRGEMDLTGEELGYIIALYDDALRSVDDAVREFLDGLRDRGLYDDALIFVTADHGESFGEHGKFLHEEAYEPCAHVPLLVKFPGGRFAGRRFADTVQLTDILPTVADVLGLPSPEGLDGQSLLAVLEGRAAARPLAYARRHGVEAVYEDGWKLLRDGASSAHEIYHLREDSKEQRNRLEDNPEPFEELRAELARFYTPSPGGWHIAVVAGAEAAQLTFTLTTGAAFTSHAPVRTAANATFEATLGETRNRLDITVRVPAGETVEFVARSAINAAPLGVQFKADTPVSTNARAAEAAPVREFLGTLEPDAFPSQEEVEQDNGVGKVMFWHVAMPGDAAATPALTPEQMQELEALGYVL